MYGFGYRRDFCDTPNEQNLTHIETIMENTPFAENKKLETTLNMARIGWWEADFSRNRYICSELIINLLGLQTNEISFKEFDLFIREDYRERISAEFHSISNNEYFEQIFPILSPRYGQVWVLSKMGSKQQNQEGSICAMGYLQCMDNPESTDKGKIAVQKVNDLLYHQSSITQSLLSFLRDDDLTDVINKILNDLLIHFNAGRAYINEFNEDENTQRCIHEVVSREELRREHNFLQTSMQNTKWWIDQLTASKPIILSSLDDMPKEIMCERALLEAQGIKSIMIVPLLSKDRVWGFAGIDIVDEFILWDNEDYQWFSSLTNIMSICMELRRSEQEAQRDKEYAQSLYKHMPVGYLRMKLLRNEEGQTVDLAFLDSNSALETVMGLTREELVGKRINQLDYANKERELKYLTEIVAGGNYANIDYQSEDSSVRTHVILYTPGNDEIVALMADTTSQHKALEMVKESEKLLRHIFTNLPAGIILYDKESNVVETNDRIHEILNAGEGDAGVNTGLFDCPLLPPEMAVKLRNGESVDFKVHLKSKRTGMRSLEDKETDTKELITKITPLYNTENKLLNYLLICIDNSETTNARLKIQEFEEFFSLIANYSKIGYFKWNLLTNEGAAISQWFKNLEKSEDSKFDTVAQVYENLHPSDLEMMEACYREIRSGESKQFSKEIRVQKADGSLKWLRCSVMVKEYDPANNIIDLVGVNFDITGLKEIEEKLIEAKEKAETLDKLKTAFIANMSHEIRTPLNAIVGFSHLLVDSDDLEEKSEYIKIVQENNDLLLQLISDILDLSKIESGTFDFAKGAVNVNMLCNDIARSLSMKTGKNVTLIFDETSPEYYIHSDKNRLTQVITNFVNNALKFTPSGSITISYELKENSFIEFSVKDTGIGISPEKIGSIFERFVKLNTFVQGTGLGLSICKSIIEQLDGKIGVESKLGQGSRFWFTHPYEADSSLIDTEKISLGEAFDGNMIVMDEHAKPLVLVAEDMDTNYLLISTVLRKEYRLVRAYNGNEAVDLFKKVRPNIILMDIKMPGMDGLEAVKLIREIDTQIPIIAVTAFALDRDKIRARQAGCNDFVPKPVSGNLLKGKIERLLKSQQKE